ncbi:hypothetical protein I4F81_006934 [Pyropia yezoensis]|uniref:Uncharacterized protein n=1 Tax=Pyropia yezoensis TaxID=2788 RepID=A0ACC3C345_PYRYE|nr:hypothetical protein I4F81_006934 [Neopyropia yezoensis]
MAAGAGNGPAAVAKDVGGDKQLLADAAAATPAELDILPATADKGGAAVATDGLAGGVAGAVAAGGRGVAALAVVAVAGPAAGDRDAAGDGPATKVVAAATAAATDEIFLAVATDGKVATAGVAVRGAGAGAGPPGGITSGADGGPAMAGTAAASAATTDGLQAAAATGC